MRSAEQQIDADLLALTRDTTDDVQRQVLIEAAIIIAVLARADRARRSPPPGRWPARCAGCATVRCASPTTSWPRRSSSLQRHQGHRPAHAGGDRGPVPDAIGIRHPRRDRRGGAGLPRRAPGSRADRGRAGRPARQRLGDVPQPGPPQSQTLVDRMIGQLDRHRARARRTRSGWPSCSSSTTSPPGCVATTRTCWCSPAPTPSPPRSRGRAAGRRAARRTVRSGAVRAHRVRRRRRRRVDRRARGQRRRAAARRTVRQRHPVLAADTRRSSSRAAGSATPATSGSRTAVWA